MCGDGHMCRDSTVFADILRADNASEILNVFDGLCISHDYKCDFVNDCELGSDEIDCGKNNNNKTNTFTTSIHKMRVLVCCVQVNCTCLTTVKLQLTPSFQLGIEVM